MNKRKLGNLEVSAIGLGCMGFSHAYGTAISKEESVRIIRKAYDMGYTTFDTAQSYLGTNEDGSISYNEELVGKALHDIRDKVQIISKFGVTHEGRTVVVDSRPETIRKAINESLERLNTTYIDLYFQHRIDPNVEPEVVASVMKELMEEGKIKYWGISEANEDYLRRAHAVCPVTAIENRYSMMYREYEKLFPVLEELNVGFIAFSPMANGLLTGKYNKNSTFDKEDYRSVMPQFTSEGMDKNQELLALVEKIANEKNATPAQISLAWMINKKPYIMPIPGSRKEERILENGLSAQIVLTKEKVNAIDKALDAMEMSEVFGGSRIKSKE